MRYWVAAITLLASVAGLHADDSPPCLNELENNFFSQELLGQALSMYEVPQGSWEPIHQQLVDRSQTVAYRVQELAMKMEPNPLEFPFNGQAAEPLLRKALFQVFNEVMHDNDVTDEGAIQAMFNYLYTRNLATIHACILDQD